jgi:hypothetical protein
VKHYDPSLLLADARRRYFDDNGFGPTGGYDEAWVDFKIGPVPFPFPNTKARVRAVKYHDLHHLVTGYETNFSGELEIASWEIASGCADMVAAWQLNLGAMGAGFLTAPRRSWRAFRRGRASRNFFRERFDEHLLSMTVGEARQKLGIDQDASSPRPVVDGVLFVAASLAGLALAVLSSIFFIPLALVAALPLRLMAMRSRKKALPAQS